MAAKDILRPDNHELFERVRGELNQRHPAVPIEDIAEEIGVTVDELCRWVLAYKEPRKAKAYQSPRFPAIGQPRKASAPSWSQPEQTRRHLAWKRQHEAARAAREATNG